MLDQLEVVSPEPAMPSLVDEGQPAAAAPLVHGYGADAEQLRGLNAGQPVVLGVGWLRPALALPRRILRPGSLSRSARSLNTWSRSSDARPMRPREVSSPLATSFPISETWHPRISAAWG